ncbi:MAG: GTP-binding protein [Candidatus Ranarchaeia archaeon]|jgi:small GTP-binding protein
MAYMIREMHITNFEGQTIYRKVFAISSDINVDAMYQTLIAATVKMKEAEIERTDIVRYRFSYLKSTGMIFFILFDRANTEEECDQSVITFAQKFLERYKDKLHSLTNKDLEVFDYDAKFIVKLLPVKLAFAGFGGVGKTTMTKLLRQEEVPLEYIPTIFGNRRPLSVQVDDYSIIIFDFAGQERFMAAWDILVRGAEVVLIATDSTQGNIQRTKEQILPLIYSKAPNAKIYIIANKQDLNGSLPPEEIEKLLGYPAFPMVAINPEHRADLLKVLREAILA